MTDRTDTFGANIEIPIADNFYEKIKLEPFVVNQYSRPQGL
jgi:hypothetical protein